MRGLSSTASRSPRFSVTRCRLHPATMEGEGGGGVGAELGLEGRGVFIDVSRDSKTHGGGREVENTKGKRIENYNSII